MFLPFPDEGFSGCLGDADDIRVSPDLLQGIENPPERFNILYGAGHGLVDRQAPLEEALQVRIPGFLHAFLKGRVSERKARFAEFAECPGGGCWKIYPADIGVIAKKLKCGEQAGKPVLAPVDRMQIHEFGGLPEGVFNRFKLPEGDNQGMKALLLFDFHGGENTAVGINADKRVEPGAEIQKMIPGIVRGCAHEDVLSKRCHRIKIKGRRRGGYCRLDF
jgi:hypothetical protein